MSIYRENIIKMMDKQMAKGKHEYGMLLEENSKLSDEECITYAQEEAIDLLFYLEKIKEILNK